MNLINLLIRELEDNWSSGGDFQVSHHAEICQFDRFSLVVIMEFPDWFKLKSKYYGKSACQYTYKASRKQSRIESSDKVPAMQDEDLKKHVLFNPPQPTSQQAAIGINSHILGPMSYYRQPPAPAYDGSCEMMGEAMQLSSMQSILSRYYLRYD